jgi:hypothetical protein
MERNRCTLRQAYKYDNIKRPIIRQLIVKFAAVMEPKYRFTKPVTGHHNDQIKSNP